MEDKKTFPFIVRGMQPRPALAHYVPLLFMQFSASIKELPKLVKLLGTVKTKKLNQRNFTTYIL